MDFLQLSSCPARAVVTSSQLAVQKSIRSPPAQELLSKSIGKPSIGGAFNLTTHDSQLFTESDLLGRWSLIYFGFTNCPDICPEELDKMGEAVESVDKERKERVTPIFISVDPARDGVKEVQRYIRGEWAQSFVLY